MTEGSEGSVGARDQGGAVIQRFSGDEGNPRPAKAKADAGATRLFHPPGDRGPNPDHDIDGATHVKATHRSAPLTMAA